MAAGAVAGENPEPSAIPPPRSAASPRPPPPPPPPPHLLLSTYLGISFAVFLGLLPRAALAYLPSLHARNRGLHLKLIQTEDQLRQMRSRRKEDSKANARVVEIFASHRNGWQQEEKRLLQQIDASAEQVAALKARISEAERSEEELRASIEKLQREVGERDEMIDFMSRKVGDGGGPEEEEDDFVEKEVEIGAYASKAGVEFGMNSEESGGGFGEYAADFSRVGKVGVSGGLSPVPEVCFLDRNGDLEEMASLYMQQNGFGRDFLSPASKAWAERSNGWQELQYESLESLYPTKHFVARRESPWKVDGESTGVSSKLKLLEQELVNLEKVGSGELSKIPSLMRKQAKRYQSLTGKIEDLCRRMQVSDPSEPTLSPEFRTQRQTEFLLETFRLQHRATETRQKLTALQTETAKSCGAGDELIFGQKTKVVGGTTARKSLDSIRNDFKEIQRNLEIWLARIMGDLEGILARDGVSRVRDYYASRYPFVR